MNARVLRFFWLAAFILTAAVIVVKSGQELWRWRATPGFLRHVKNAADDIVSIEIDRLKEKIVFEKKDGAWRLMAPQEYPVDEMAVLAMVDAAKAARVEERVTSRPEKFSELDIDVDHAIGLLMRTAKNKVAVQGRIGKQLLGSWDRSYFKFENNNDVYIVKGLPRYQFDKSLGELKSKKILEAPKDQIASITVEHGKKSFTLKRDGENWSVNGKPAKAQAALDIANIYTLLEANDFATSQETAGGLKPLGLDGKATQARVKIALLNGRNFDFWIGSKKDTLYFAKLADQPTIWKIADWKVDPLKVNESDLKAPKKAL